MRAPEPVAGVELAQAPRLLTGPLERQGNMPTEPLQERVRNDFNIRASPEQMSGLVSGIL